MARRGEQKCPGAQILQAVIVPVVMIILTPIILIGSVSEKVFELITGKISSGQLFWSKERAERVFP